MNRRQFGCGMLSAGGAALAGTPPAGPAVAAKETQALPFRLSVMLWTILPKEPMNTRLGVVAEAGYHAVQLDDEFLKWEPHEYDQFRQRCNQLGLVVDTIVLDGPGMAIPDQGGALAASFKKSLVVAERLGSPSIIVLSGDRLSDMSEAAQRSICIDNLRRGADLTAAKGVTLMLENINAGEDPNYFVQRAADGFDIVKAAAHPHVKMLYDLFHEQLMAGNLIAKLKDHADILGMVHVADVPGRHEPGTGEINYANVFRALADIRFSHSVAMEFHPLKDPVIALREARQLVEMSVGTPA